MVISCLDLRHTSGHLSSKPQLVFMIKGPGGLKLLGDICQAMRSRQAWHFAQNGKNSIYLIEWRLKQIDHQVPIPTKQILSKPADATLAFGLHVVQTKSCHAVPISHDKSGSRPWPEPKGLDLLHV